MSELAEGARLEIACTALKAVPRVRIPLSPPFLSSYSIRLHPVLFGSIIAVSSSLRSLVALRTELLELKGF
jgi:hypothetical protein